MRTVTLPLAAGTAALAVVAHADGTATLYEAGDTLPADLVAQPAFPRRIDAAAFRDRFTPAELAGVTALAYGGTGDVPAQLLLLKVATNRDGIDLDDAETIGGLDYLISKGKITAPRKVEILA
jgi:hypothetical protein